jgi:anaerobic magnesium-protoporphyrin IX monomethyl ester cyclase
MKLTILSPNPPDCVAFGPRQLASVLREHGHDCSIVFLRGSVKLNRFDASYVYQYPPSLLDDVVEACRDADVVGVSFMSLYYDRGVQLTRAIQSRLGKKVIWGGTHPTLRPEQSIRIADYVCVGEGEIALLDWLQRWEDEADLTNVPGIWARDGERIHRNGEAPELPDINAIPWPDMDTEDHFVNDGDRLVPMSNEMMFRVLPRLPHFDGTQHIGVRVMATRGCPHRCSYCASSAQNSMRRRTVESTIEHLEWLKKRYPFIQTVYEFDDTFFANSWSWLSEFSEKYHERINLPWHCQTSPSTLTEEKLRLLVDAGLVFCEMGIQSGSDEIKRLFRRSESEKQVLKAAQLLHDFWKEGELIQPRYHIITDNPWESNASVLMTANMLINLPRPFELAIGSLCLFPGTALNELAWDDGLLWDEVSQVYRKPFLRPEPTLLNWLIYASAINWIPKGVLRGLAKEERLERLQALGAFEAKAISKTMHLSTNLLDRVPRALDALRTRDTNRIRMAFQHPS